MNVKITLVVASVLLVAMLYGMPHISPAPQKQTTPMPANGVVETAIFAAGCFWCVEANFEKVDGVIEAVSGYTGGNTENPTYEEVCSHKTGHLEAVKVTYDPQIVGYNDLLEFYWRAFDPTDAGGSFADRGQSYTSAIFVANDRQRKLAEKSKQALQDSGRFSKKIVTPIRDAVAFYRAEEYHQDYYTKKSYHYKLYRNASGRDRFAEAAWGEDLNYQIAPKPKTAASSVSLNWNDQLNDNFVRPGKSSLKQSLTSEQYYVTQEEGTERPFSNEYANEKRVGIYVDVVSGEPLFSSKDKYDSGTGWPSFTRALVAENIVELTDNKLLVPRTEVRSRHANSHLGHVFDDGPAPTGRRYCINSAALRFVPAEKLDESGYSFFKAAFEKLEK